MASPDSTRDAAPPNGRPPELLIPDGGDGGIGEAGAYGYSYGYGGYGQKPASIFGRTLTDYLQWFLKYLWLIVFLTVIGLLVGYHMFSIAPPQYSSHTAIEFKRIKRESVDVDENEKLMLDTASYFASTLEKLKLPALYQDIASNPSFANRSDLMPASAKWRWPWQDAPSAGGSSSDERVSAPQLAAMMPGWIRVTQRQGTTILDLYASHTNPDVCRDVLQQLLIEYERYLEQEVSGTERVALDFLFEKSDEVREAIITYQKSLDQYRECLKYDQQLAQTQDEIIRLRTRYLEKWPPLVEATELIRLVSQQFETELANVLASSQEEAEYWRQQTPGIDRVSADEALEIRRKVLQTRVSLLERQLRQEESILATLMEKISAADLSQGFEGKGFKVLQPPGTGSKTGPDRNGFLRKYGAIGFGVSIGLVLLLGFFDSSVRTVTDLEAMTGIPVVGAIPQLSRKKDGNRPLFVIEQSSSHSAEAMRSLRAGLCMLGDRKERKTFLVTSSLPGEGKSVLSANLAIAFAQQRDRTLLIDADLRKPVQQIIFNSNPNAKGLADLLTQEASMAEIIQPTQVENLWIITCGTRSPNPSELLGSKNLETFVSSMAEHFDRIIIDSAPIVPVADTLPIARQVQSVLLCCRLGSTPRKALNRSMKTLAVNRSLPSGMVANYLPIPKRTNTYSYYYGYHGGVGYGDDQAYASEAEEEKPKKRSSRRKKASAESQASPGARSDAADLLG